MLRLGPVRIGSDELSSIMWSERCLTIVFRWEWGEVPVLLDLHSPLLWKWSHHDDGNAGLTVTVRGGELSCTDDGDALVTIELTRLVDGAGASNG